MWGRLAALVVKEFRAIWRDRRSRAVLILPPLVQLLIFAYAATFDVDNARLAILNQDMSAESRDLVARFTASDGFRPVARLDHVDEIAPTIDEKRALAVLHIGPDFAADLKGSGAAEVQLILDGRRANSALVVLGYADEIVAGFVRDQGETAGAAGPPATLVSRAWFNPNLKSQWFIVPGLVGTLTLVVTMVVAGLSVARERELGTYEQLMVTPLRPVEVLIGKMVPALLIGLFEGAAITAIAIYWFQVPFRGDLALLALALVLFLISSVSVGLMISAYARTQQQAIVGAFLFLMPAIILSGFATPIDNMPTFVQLLTYADPLRYMLVILRGLFLRDLPVELVLQQLWPMLVIAVVTGVVAVWLFRKRVQ
ncbi:ABC transporter permease [Rhodovibrio salinarum]|uniref:ABC transporter permease n=1 Tax=Rhodovibrio salinarum TaxID=1087 RepID=A0A934QJE3_9PROT|nr:ABC transporter permease [Rhodovibrio salinarum]MBK1698168.1 ABC transporter permease [Rhodovibrio salinarum]